MLTNYWMLHCIQIISYSFQRLLCAENVTPVVPRYVAPLLPPHRKGMKTMQLAMHKNARSKAHKCRIRHKGFNLGADFGMERVLITNEHLARFPRPIPSAPKIMEFQSYFQSFEMSPDVTRCHQMSPCRCTSLVISMTTALCRRMRPSLVWENLQSFPVLFARLKTKKNNGKSVSKQKQRWTMLDCWTLCPQLVAIDTFCNLHLKKLFLNSNIFSYVFNAFDFSLSFCLSVFLLSFFGSFSFFFAIHVSDLF